MKMKKVSIKQIVIVLMVFSTLAVSLFTSENASAHAPTAIYPSYKEGTLTVYIDHPSDDPDSHYIETVTVTVNRVEVLSETYTSQTVDDKGKGMVTYSYAVVASEGDVISVTAECSIDGSITEFLTVGESDSKDDPKDDPKDYPDKNTSKDGYPDKDGDITEDVDSNKEGESSQDNGNILLLSGAIVVVLVVIIALVAVLLDWRKGTADKSTTRKGTKRKNMIKKNEWTTCPKCGSSIRIGQFSSHLDAVHPKLTQKSKEKMIEEVMKRG